MSTPRICKLALADGTVFQGTAIGHAGSTAGELCFNTAMTGYQEILTDPSYFGQIVVMTSPHIGNYGTADEDQEASGPVAAGLIVRAFSSRYSNNLREESLMDYMCRHGLVGISGIDTRRLVRHLRSQGVMNGVISTGQLDDRRLVEQACKVPSMEGLELASHVTTRVPYDFSSGERARIAVYDFGVKRSILRSLSRRGCALRVFPAPTPLSRVLDWDPDGLLFSNGPGDPRAMPEVIETVRAATQTALPLFGICLGHQLMALACGFRAFKMRVGHRGANHPVQNLETRRVEITTQNHGFAVETASIDPLVAELTHVNLNDDTVEGLRFREFAGLSIQYHPEASPGPHDSRYLFDVFLDMLPERRQVAVRGISGATGQTGRIPGLRAKCRGRVGRIRQVVSENQ